VEKLSFKIHLHGVKKKTETRSYEIDRHIGYFSFFTNKI